MDTVTIADLKDRCVALGTEFGKLVDELFEDAFKDVSLTTLDDNCEVVTNSVNAEVLNWIAESKHLKKYMVSKV